MVRIRVELRKDDNEPFDNDLDLEEFINQEFGPFLEDYLMDILHADGFGDLNFVGELIEPNLNRINLTINIPGLAIFNGNEFTEWFNNHKEELADNYFGDWLHINDTAVLQEAGKRRSSKKTTKRTTTKRRSSGGKRRSSHRRRI